MPHIALPRSAYFVAIDDRRIVGGGGVAPLQGGPHDVCELKKLYLLPEARGRGIGQALLTRCLNAGATGRFKCDAWYAREL